MTAAAVQTPEQIAKRFGCTVEQARAQLAANAKQLEGMAAKARAAGKKFRGFTAEYLEERAQSFRLAAK